MKRHHRASVEPPASPIFGTGLIREGHPDGSGSCPNWRSGNPSHDPVRVTHDLRVCSAARMPTMGFDVHAFKRLARALVLILRCFPVIFARNPGSFLAVAAERVWSRPLIYSARMVNGATKKAIAAASPSRPHASALNAADSYCPLAGTALWARSPSSAQPSNSTSMVA